MTIGRRGFLVRGGTTALVVLGAPSLLAGCGGDELACTSASPAEASERAAAHYLDHTTSGTRNCLSCTFFTSAGPNACGSCSMNLGHVSPMGVCDRFAARS